MNRIKSIAPGWIAWLLVTLIVCPLAAQNASSLDDLRGLIASGKSREALDQINKQLFPTPQDPALKYELLMLKGESQLQLKDRMGASTAFRSAVTAAQDPMQIAAARANALIVEKSNMGMYKPRSALSSTPIDIMQLDARKQAMLAMADDLSKQYKGQIDSALTATSLPPIEKVFTPVADIYFLQTFATGQPGEMDKTLRELGARAFKLMQSAIGTTVERIDYLTQVANSSSSSSQNWNVTRMGLTSQQRDEVKAMIPFLNQIRQRASEYRGIAARLGGDKEKWEGIVADAVDAASQAESLYDDR